MTHYPTTQLEWNQVDTGTDMTVAEFKAAVFAKLDEENFENDGSHLGPISASERAYWEPRIAELLAINPDGVEAVIDVIRQMIYVELCMNSRLAKGEVITVVNGGYGERFIPVQPPVAVAQDGSTAEAGV